MNHNKTIGLLVVRNSWPIKAKPNPNSRNVFSSNSIIKLWTAFSSNVSSKLLKLNWSHIVEILSIKNENARNYYMNLVAHHTLFYLVLQLKVFQYSNKLATFHYYLEVLLPFY